MQSATNLVPEKPVIISIEIVCGLIWLYIYYYNVEAKKFAFNYQRIVQHQEWWRTLSSSLSHIQLLHLAFNLVTLWSTGFMERVFGSAFYFQLTFLLFVISNISMLLVYYIMSKHFNKAEYVNNVYAVGYSAILFGFMGFQCMRSNGNYPVFGVVIPFYLGPFVFCVLISLLVPNASFVGHFSGILAGMILGIQVICEQLMSPLFWISFIAFVAIIMYSVYRSNLFGVANNESLLVNSSSNRKARIVNGVIVRDNGNV